MKKSTINKIVAAITITLICGMVSLIGLGGYYYFENILLSDEYVLRDSMETKRLISESEYADHIRVKGNPSVVGTKKMLHAIEVQDKNLLKLFFNYGGLIELNDADTLYKCYYGTGGASASEEFTKENGYIMGGYFTNHYSGEKGYVVGIHLTDSYKYIHDDTLTHELGHFLDYFFHNISTDQKFIDIYNREAENSGLERYFTHNSIEYFAESYAQMTYDPEFEQKCPETCAYIQRYINWISG